MSTEKHKRKFDTIKYLQAFEEDTGCKISTIASKLRLQTQETKEKNWQTFSKNNDELTTFIEIYTIVMGIVAYTLKSNQIPKKPSQNSIKALTSKLITKLPKSDNNKHAMLTKSEYMNNLHHLLNEIHDEIQEGILDSNISLESHTSLDKENNFEEQNTITEETQLIKSAEIKPIVSGKPAGRDAAVDKLNEMYPNLGKSTIETTLNECNGDAAATIVKLQKMQSIIPQQVAVEGNSTTNTVQQPQPMQTVLIYQDINNMTAKQRQDYIKQQMVLNNGNVWRIILIVLWSIILCGCGVLILFGSIFMNDSPYYLPLLIFVFLLPAILEGTLVLLCIYGAYSYKYGFMIFGCVWSGIHVLLGFFQLIQWLINNSIVYPLIIMYILLPVIYFSCILAFSIILTNCSIWWKM